MRPGLLVLAIAACGGHGGQATPQDRGRVRLVRCRPAPPLPMLEAEGPGHGGLLGIEGGVGVGMIGVLRPSGPLPGLGSNAKPGISIALGTPSVAGALAPAAITGALQPRVAELAACASREKQMMAAGTAVRATAVEWRLTLGATGKVILAEAASHGLSPPIAACVTGVLRGATFPAPPGGRVVAVTLPIAFDATGAPPEPPEAEPATPWTPFALDAGEAATVSDQTARAAEGAVRGKLDAIEACFAGSPATGSLRAMLAVDSDGALTSARVGGLGDKVVEACVENAVTGLRVVLPSASSAELACDLSRGDAQPWRVTPDRGGYGVVEVSRTRVRYGDQVLSATEEPDALTDHTTFLLVADPDAPGAMLSLAMKWTADADATLVAVRAAGAPGAAPQLLGAGHTATAEGSGGDGEETPATLEVGAGRLTACAGRWRQAAKLAEPAAVDGAAHKLAARCRTRSCSPSLIIAVGRDAVARDLAQVAGAARRAGFERVLFVRGASGTPAGGDLEDAPGGATCAESSAGDDP